MTGYTLVKKVDGAVEVIEISESIYHTIKRLKEMSGDGWESLVTVLFDWIIEVVEWMKSDFGVDVAALTGEAYMNLVSATKFGLRTWALYQEEFFGPTEGGDDEGEEVEV